jgi:SAM-dependent methyltransferase
VTNPWRDPEHGRRFPAGATEANPSRPEQIEVLLALAAAHRPRRILDAGCGPGFLAERLLAACPGAELVGFDFAEEMVAAAQARLGARARIFRAAFEGDWEGAAGGGFDLVVCVQAIHHLDDHGKRRGFLGFFRVLRPQGLYLQSDPVGFGDEKLFPLLKALWDRLLAGAGFAPLPEAYGPEEARRDFLARGDLLANLDDQLRWLREAGFDPVECFWRHGNRAIFGGLKPR